MNRGALLLKPCVLSLAAALVVLLVLVNVVVLPWFEHNRRYDEAIAERSDQVARYQRMLQTFPELQAQLEQVNNDQQLREYYFSAETSALAGAKVQGKIKDIISTSGGSLTSTQVLSGSKEDPTQKVQVRVQMRGDTATLIDVLYKIEEARPLLFIEQLSVRAQARRATRRTSRSRRSTSRRVSVPPLTVRLDIYGFVQPERQG